MIGSVRMQHFEFAHRRIHNEQRIHGEHQDANAATCLPLAQAERQQHEEQQHEQEYAAVGAHRTVAGLWNIMEMVRPCPMVIHRIVALFNSHTIPFDSRPNNNSAN